jgi:hypothetical protein
MRNISEAYRRIGDPDDRFDLEFWQSQGDPAIFAAALEMISDYLILRYGQADQPRLERTVEFLGGAREGESLWGLREEGNSNVGGDQSKS